MEYKNNDPRFKAIYQEYDWCYQKYIVEGLNHADMATLANCKKRVVEKWCQERHRLTQKFRQINTTLNRTQESLIIGSLLGDGHIDKRENTPVFIVSHADNQKDYLFFKYSILKNLCNIDPVYQKGGEKEFYGKMFNRRPQYRLCTRVYDCFKKYRSMSNIELLNSLDELSFSILMLDDGNRGRSNWSLCIAEYTDIDMVEFQNIIKEKFNLIGSFQKDTRYYIFKAESSRLIDNIILNNIPNDLDIIKYKIIEKYRSKIGIITNKNDEVKYG